jgi:hypothetical protein
MMEGVTDLLAKAITSGDSTRSYRQVEFELDQIGRCRLKNSTSVA